MGSLNNDKTVESKFDGVNMPHNYDFESIKIRSILKFLEGYENTEVDCRAWLHMPSGNNETY